MKITKIRNPIIPRKPSDPANQFGNLRNARTKQNNRFAIIKREMHKLINSFNPTLKTATNVAKYEYLVDAQRYNAIDLFIQRLLYEQLLDDPNGVFSNQWWLVDNLSDAYQDGTSDAIQSAKNVTNVVAGIEVVQQVMQLDLQQQVFSQGYQSRVGLVYSRVFNEMKDISNSEKTKLSEILAQGMAAGKGIRELVTETDAQINKGYNRVTRIVRTEVLNAYRTATAAETDDINENIYSDSDWHMLSLWFSALAGTSRPNHVSRHGLTYTTSEVRDFYSVDGNAINCLCSQSVVLVNKKTGKVLQEKLLDRMEKQKETYQASHPVKPKKSKS